MFSLPCWFEKNTLGLFIQSKIDNLTNSTKLALKHLDFGPFRIFSGVLRVYQRICFSDSFFRTLGSVVELVSERHLVGQEEGPTFSNSGTLWSKG